MPCWPWPKGRAPVYDPLLQQRWRRVWAPHTPVCESTCRQGGTCHGGSRNSFRNSWQVFPFCLSFFCFTMFTSNKRSCGSKNIINYPWLAIWFIAPIYGETGNGLLLFLPTLPQYILIWSNIIPVKDSWISPKDPNLFSLHLQAACRDVLSVRNPAAKKPGAWCGLIWLMDAYGWFSHETLLLSPTLIDDFPIWFPAPCG